MVESDMPGVLFDAASLSWRVVLYHYRKCALVERAWDTAKGVYSGEHSLEPIEVILGKIIPLPKGEVDDDDDDDDDDDEKGIEENAIAPRALPPPPPPHEHCLQIVPFEAKPAPDDIARAAELAPALGFWQAP